MVEVRGEAEMLEEYRVAVTVAPMEAFVVEAGSWEAVREGLREAATAEMVVVAVVVS